MPKTLKKYRPCESHNSIGHNGTTQLYQCLKRQYYQNGLKESVQKFVRHCLQCQTTNLQTPHHVQLHLEIPQTPIYIISINKHCSLGVVCLRLLARILWKGVWSVSNLIATYAFYCEWRLLLAKYIGLSSYKRTTLQTCRLALVCKTGGLLRS